MIHRSPPAILIWAGIAACAGLTMVTFVPRLPGDSYPLVAVVVLAAGLLLRLRSGPLLFFGLWICGELRPLLPNPQGLPWEALPGSPEAGSTVALAAASAVYLFASCQVQFLGAGTYAGARVPFTVTLPDSSPHARLVRVSLALALRVVGGGFVVLLFETGARWAGATDVGAVFGEAARTGALFWQAALVFVVVGIVLDLARFLALDRTSAACYLNDMAWLAHGKTWAYVDKRTR